MTNIRESAETTVEIITENPVATGAIITAAASMLYAWRCRRQRDQLAEVTGFALVEVANKFNMFPNEEV